MDEKPPAHVPPGVSLPTPGPRRLQVRQMGRPDQAGAPKAVGPDPLQGVHDLFARLMLEPAKFSNVDPLLLDLLNQVRVLHIELAALRQVTIERGLVTPQELQAQRVRLVVAAEQELKQALAQLGRSWQQKPGQAAPGGGNGP